MISIGVFSSGRLCKETMRMKSSRTDWLSVPEVYAACDVSDMAYKQIVISMGRRGKSCLVRFY